MSVLFTPSQILNPHLQSWRSVGTVSAERKARLDHALFGACGVQDRTRQSQRGVGLDITPGFVNANMGFLGLTVRRTLKSDTALRQKSSHSAINQGARDRQAPGCSPSRARNSICTKPAYGWATCLRAFQWHTSFCPSPHVQPKYLSLLQDPQRSRCV